MARLFGSRTGFAGNGVFHAAVAANGRPADPVSDDVAFAVAVADCEEDWDAGADVLGVGELDVDGVVRGAPCVVCGVDDGGVDDGGVDDGEVLCP
jgi:hypothetical protein